MGKVSYIARMGEPELQRIVGGYLKSTIDAHGPITRDSCGSASKRIASGIIAAIRQQVDIEKAHRRVPA